MGFEIDEDEFNAGVADAVEEIVQEWIETELGNGNIECDCGSRSFDVSTWKNSSGKIEAAGVCRECNERTEFDVDMSEIDALR